MPTLIVSNDHGGVALKQELLPWLKSEGYQVQDMGPNQIEPSDDYPPLAIAVGKAVAKGSGADELVGILFCRSGGGMAIAANKVKGVRAVVATTPQQASHARAHNHANVLSIGADDLDVTTARQVITAFVTTPYDTDQRHVRRINQISEFEGS